MQTYDIDILDYIRTGHDRAITRAELSDLTGIDDRTIRDMIHYARRDIPILNMQDGRGQQFCGSNGDADVVGLPGIHIECKRVEKLNIYEAVEQSINDAREGEIPTVMHRKNHKPWLVTLPFENFIEMYRKCGTKCKDG